MNESFKTQWNNCSSYLNVSPVQMPDECEIHGSLRNWVWHSFITPSFVHSKPIKSVHPTPNKSIAFCVRCLPNRNLVWHSFASISIQGNLSQSSAISREWSLALVCIYQIHRLVQRVSCHQEMDYGTRSYPSNLSCFLSLDAESQLDLFAIALALNARSILGVVVEGILQHPVAFVPVTMIFDTNRRRILRNL